MKDFANLKKRFLLALKMAKFVRNGELVRLQSTSGAGFTLVMV